MPNLRYYFLFDIFSNNSRNRLAFVQIFLFTILFLDSILLRADAATMKENMDENVSIGKPKLIVDKEVYDFGNIKPHSKNIAVFNFTNVGNVPLIVKDIQRCCGAVISIDNNNKEIAPGQSEIIKVQYTFGKAGIFNKTISMTTNDPDKHRIKLTIKGNIIPTLTWTPENFDIFAYKEKNCPEITIKSLDGTSFSVKNFSCSGKILSINLNPKYTASKIVLKPKIDIEKLHVFPSNAGYINIELNHPDYQMIRLNFNIIHSLQANPFYISVFNAKVNEPVIKTIEIQDNEIQANKDISEQIESVATIGGAKTEIIKSVIHDKNCKLDLKISYSENNDFETPSIMDHLIIKMKDGRELDIPIRIYYTK